jgi:transmembrane sensor
MSLKLTVNKVRPQIREEATEWLVAFCEQEVDASGRESFDRWLRASPEHVRAYLQICAVWESTGLLADNTTTNIAPIVQRAPADDNVIALSAKEMPARISSGGSTSSQRPTVSPGRRRAIAACFLLACFIAGGMVWWQLTRAPMYETGAAEQRTVGLPDGSTVQLNARSRIELHFTTHERVVDLIEGQAMFSVARNPSRAFIVHSDIADVRAVGTRFDVYRKSSGTVVTVIEGKVATAVDHLPENSVRGQGSAARKPASSVVVSAGEQAVATSRAPIHPYRTNVFAATAWTEGKLMFDSAPLREVVAEFNRIGARRLIIEDAALLDLHVSGVFPATDPTSFVLFLRERFGVTVVETEEQVRITGAVRR